MNKISNYKFLKYDYHKLNRKSNGIALGICVLNEGNKIKKQLTILQKKKINQIVDILICDANSNDGSTNVDFLKKVGVKILIKKKCEGKLSRQIQILLDCTLKFKYNGIILVDGNNKDDMKYIYKFVEKINQNYDYVHGSRYAKNGYEINTPIIRKFLTKYIHPFIFNIGNRYKYSDTANGFRGISTKFIKLNKSKIFKEHFINYNLQYFLSRLSLKKNILNCEIGVGRSYKKIHLITRSYTSGFGYFIVLKDLIFTKIGIYD